MVYLGWGLTISANVNALNSVNFVHIDGRFAGERPVVGGRFRASALGS